MGIYKVIPCDRYNLALSLESIIKNKCSIYQFLQFANLDEIIVEIETYYTRKPQFHAKGMFILAVAYHFYNKSYEKLLASISPLDIELLNFENRELPKKSSLNEFIIHRIGEEKLELLMQKLAILLYNLYSIEKTKKIGNEDSTPLEASRYDKNAKYNPHYKCKMDKAHITMFETVPLYMSYTSGTEGDNPESIKNMKVLSKLGIRFNYMNKDGSYDSFENYADTYALLGAKPNIAPAENAVINKEGTIERINDFINSKKYWKQGLSIKDPVEKKLKFFYQKGGLRKEQVGKYLRNKVIENGVDETIYPLRKHQERIHNHIKQTVKFDVRRVHKKTKKLHTLWSLISYQILCLSTIQNNLNPNEFGFIQ